jgi:hypothetical protein
VADSGGGGAGGAADAQTRGVRCEQYAAAKESDTWGPFRPLKRALTLPLPLLPVPAVVEQVAVRGQGSAVRSEW